MSCVSILLTGAELAEFKSSANLQLFWSQREDEGEENVFQEAVELRCKSGTFVEFSTLPFTPTWSRDDDSETGENPSAAGKLRFMAASQSPFVLKSRAVMDEEKQMKWGENPSLSSSKNRKSSRKETKQRAFSMDETQLEQMDGSRHWRSITRDDLFSSSSRRNWIKPLPLPLPLPPDDGGSPRRASKHHRRHLSIDLRAAPAAKFLVQLMPWEIPCDSPERDRCSGGASLVVPFKWEEAPGKPKSGLGPPGGNTGFTSGLKLRLPPRLQQQQVWSSKGSSPTSTLDQRVAESSSSTSSSPNEERLIIKPKRTQQVKVRSRITALLACRTVEDVEHPEPVSVSVSTASSATAPTGSTTKRRMRITGRSWSSNNGVGGSWSPSPRLTWLQRSGLEMQERMMSINRTGAFGKLANGCNVVKRAMRCRWWVCRRKGGSKKQRKSIYKPLLCSVDGG